MHSSCYFVYLTIKIFEMRIVIQILHCISLGTYIKLLNKCHLMYYVNSDLYSMQEVHVIRGSAINFGGETIILVGCFWS